MRKTIAFLVSLFLLFNCMLSASCLDGDELIPLPDFYFLIPPDATPTPLSQWNLELIGARSAWGKAFSGSTAVKLAVIDTGVSQIPDLENNINWELAKNIVDGSSNVEDLNGHGTFVAGLIAADINGKGVDGLCPELSLIPIKVSGSNVGAAHPDDIVKAIEYCEEIGVDIINLSYGCVKKNNKSIADAIRAFSGLTVLAAGNDGMLDLDTAEGNYYRDIPNLIVVGASDKKDCVSKQSNFGYNTVHLFAPGEDVASLSYLGGYIDVRGIGTSYAAPHVSAAAAIIMAEADHYTPIQIKQLLMYTADSTDELIGKCQSGGRLNIDSAVEYLYAEQRPLFSVGDVNGDGIISVTDRDLIQDSLLGKVELSEKQLLAIDRDGNGTVNVSDYLSVIVYIEKIAYYAPYYNS